MTVEELELMHKTPTLKLAVRSRMTVKQIPASMGSSRMKLCNAREGTWLLSGSDSERLKHSPPCSRMPDIELSQIILCIRCKLKTGLAFHAARSHPACLR